MPFFLFFRRQLKKKKSSYFVSDRKSLKVMDKKLSEMNIIGIDTEFDWMVAENIWKTYGWDIKNNE